MAVDTTLVSPLSRNGAARRRAANHDGAALDEPPGQDGGSLVSSLECYPGLQRSKVVCRLLAGPQSHTRDRRRCALSARGSEG